MTSQTSTKLWLLVCSSRRQAPELHLQESASIRRLDEERGPIQARRQGTDEITAQALFRACRRSSARLAIREGIVGASPSKRGVGGSLRGAFVSFRRARVSVSLWWCAPAPAWGRYARRCCIACQLIKRSSTAATSYISGSAALLVHILLASPLKPLQLPLHLQPQPWSTSPPSTTTMSSPLSRVCASCITTSSCLKC